MSENSKANPFAPKEPVGFSDDAETITGAIKNEPTPSEPAFTTEELFSMLREQITVSVSKRLLDNAESSYNKLLARLDGDQDFIISKFTSIIELQLLRAEENQKAAK